MSIYIRKSMPLWVDVDFRNNTVLQTPLALFITM